MASSAFSSDEGEIVEATPLPRSEQNADPSSSRRSRTRSRSRSPRGFKRARDDTRDRRGSRQLRVHYEEAPRRRPYRDLDRPPSRGSDRYDDRSYGRYASREPASPRHPRDRDRDRDHDRRDDGYPYKRHRTRSRSPGHGGAGRGRGRRPGDRPGEDHRDPSPARRANLPEHRREVKQDGKPDQGATVERGIHDLAISQTSAPAQEPEPDMDWDPESTMDEEAREQAEIERRRKAREAALKRSAGAAAPTIQALQSGDRPASTPGSTRLSTPALQPMEGVTPTSNGPSSPPLSPSKVQADLSPGAFNFADDQSLINAHSRADEDGPSAADYDPTADMKEDERRDEMRHGNVGLHGEPRRPSKDDEAPAPVEEDEAVKKKKEEEEDDDEFDMFAEDFVDKFAPKAAPKPAEQQASQAGGAILDGTDKEGYYKIRPGELLDGRYQVSTGLGRGMFAGVARAVDITTNRVVAIKIMRNNDALKKGGFTEIAILEKLNAADPEDKKHIVRFERSFEYKAHLCMVFENLSMNLREVLKKFGNNIGINLNATRAYAYQIFLALGHMRKCSIIHADLKPDNILVNEARNVLKICDLGTAIDRSDAATTTNEPMPYLVSRFYRAPEIILGVPFDYAVDMWSIGCTLYELYTGKILFTGENNNQMLKNIMEIRGKLSAKLYRRGDLAQNHFDELGNFISVERDKLGKTTVRTLASIKPTRDLRARLLAASAGMTDAESRELNHFIDLLERCLTLNPDKRITPAEALKHPFFTHRVQAGHGHGAGR
ncbi:hypothetical protein VTJ83DRAFT_4690 [Remersonia thermophila]|uniref:non-specific serine/threonine protein kinase n=1 Tax=Remersonia thermophila TaxID=72144 RepID=A0ABR4DAM5_9PEZI